MSVKNFESTLAVPISDPGLQHLYDNPPQTGVEQEPALIDAAREAELRRLLDPPFIDHKGNAISYCNYEYAKESGLIDMFAYDPDQHFDGLMHLLTGEVHKIDGKRSIQGFHLDHDPEYVGTVYRSRVDSSHMDGANSKHRKHFIRRPFEPYRAIVEVGGFEKTTTVRDESAQDEQGRNRLKVVVNAMFPPEYDPIAAMQAIRIARDTRDKSQDMYKDGKIVSKSTVPMIDGKTQMDMVLILTEDEKVFTAFPKVKESGYMKLTDLAINEALGLTNGGSR